MKKMLRLTKQRLKADWKIYLAALLLTCLTCSAYLIYQSYMEQIGLNYSRRTAPLQLLADLQVELPSGEYLFDVVEPTGSWKNRPVPQATAKGRLLELSSPYGQVTVLALDAGPDYKGPLPKTGEALVNQALNTPLGIPGSGSLRLSGQPLAREINLKLGGSYRAGATSGHLLVLLKDIEPSLGTKGNNIFLYELEEQMQVKTATDVLNRFYPDAQIITAAQPLSFAQGVVTDTYQGFGGLIVLIFTFLTFGVLTAFLLSFIDSKREISVLKSIGLMPKELWILFLLCGLVSAILGLLAGMGLAWTIVKILQGRGIALTIWPRQIYALAWRVTLAYVLAIVFPAGLARRATVNQLLLDQPIPLISQQIKNLKRHHIIFEERLAAGWQIMQLPVIEGVLEGFIFKSAGDQVKVGEVIGFSPGWWGLTYTEYIATIDGEVAFWQEESGIIAIRPHGG